ncbi:hypothetical protein QYR09_16865 [Cellulophaga lytica]|nr:hypothetical protein QYR09_16865 [Cellulophaga lytica]
MSVLILVTTIACLLHYSTSKRAVITNDTKLLYWLHKRNILAKISALVVFVISFILAIYTLGFGAGILTFLLLVMLLWSLIVLLTPLKIIDYKLVLVIFVLAIFLEQTL